MESSSEGGDQEGSGDMEVKIVNQMEDLSWETLWELIPVIEEDSDYIPILEGNWDPIPIPPPHIGNLGIVKMASQVSRQHCIHSLG